MLAAGQSPSTRHAASLLLAVLAIVPATAAAADPAGADFFETKVPPVLAEHCFGCHSAKAEKQKGGLLLDTRAGLLKGGDAGPVVVPGDPSKSRLVAAINYKDVDLQRPPKGKLPDAVIRDLRSSLAFSTYSTPLRRRRNCGTSTNASCQRSSPSCGIASGGAAAAVWHR